MENQEGTFQKIEQVQTSSAMLKICQLNKRIKKANLVHPLNIDLTSMDSADDYYQKDGKKIPNWNKNQKRIPPTVAKLQTQDIGKVQELFTKIQNNSEYYREQLPGHIVRYAVVNEGQKKLVLLYGDSFAQYSSYRFMQLYEKAKKQNRTSELPTLVIVIFSGGLLIPYEQNYNFFLEWIKDFRPDRIFFIYLWQFYRIYHGFSIKHNFDPKKRTQNDESFYENIGYFAKAVKNATDSGIQVYTSNFQPTGQFYKPTNMYNIRGIIQKNIKPFRLSVVNATYIHLANFLEKELMKAGAKKVVDFTDHSCWEDLCHLLIPTGYPAHRDPVHWKNQISRHWVTSVDFFIEFDQEEP